MTDITSVLAPDLRTQQLSNDRASALLGSIQADPALATNDAVIRDAAEAFEAVFLAEMLKHTGIGQMGSVVNGGPGEAAFTGFLTEAYAKSIAESRSVGIADQVYRSLSARVQP